MTSLKELIKNISKNEWKFLIIISLLLIALISAPFIYSIVQQNDNAVYNGKHALAPGDLPVYYSYINQIKDGNYLLINQFTSEPDQLKILNVFWLGTGLFARLFNLPAPIALHIFRIILIPIFIFSLYLFLNLFFKNRNFKKTLVVLLSLSSGIGLYFTKFNTFENTYLKAPIDLWVPESNIFISLYHSPHYALSWILLIFTFIFFILAVDNNKFLYSIYAGICSLVLFQFHPYHFLTIYLVTFTYCLIKYFQQKNGKIFLYFLIVCAISSLSIIYHLYTLTDPLISARSLQNLTLTPPFIYVVLGFGIFFPLAVIGLIKIFKQKKEDKYIFLIIWLISSLLLIYLPNYQFQRRLLQGLQIPLITLAIFPFWAIIKKYSQKISKTYFFTIIIFGFILIIMPTTIYNVSRDAIFTKNFIPIYYLSSSQNEIIKFLAKQPPGQDVILCHDILFCNIIPSRISNKIFVGHGHESLNFEYKTEISNQFFSEELSGQNAENLIKNHNISIIIAENQLNYNFLQMQKKVGDYYIYQIKNQ